MFLFAGKFGQSADLGHGEALALTRKMGQLRLVYARSTDGTLPAGKAEWTARWRRAADGANEERFRYPADDVWEVSTCAEDDQRPPSAQDGR